MTYAGAYHQGEIRMLWLHVGEFECVVHLYIQSDIKQERLSPAQDEDNSSYPVK